MELSDLAEKFRRNHWYPGRMFDARAFDAVVAEVYGDYLEMMAWPEAMPVLAEGLQYPSKSVE